MKDLLAVSQMEDTKELRRLANVGLWYETVFACRFVGDIPKPETPLFGSRLRIQIEGLDGWKDWKRRV